MRRTTGLLVLFLGASLPLAAQPTVSADGAAELDRYLSSVVRDTDIPGLVALVTTAEGTIYEAAFGDQDRGLGRPMLTDTLFRIASMTKPVTSAMVMMLVEAGEVDLDDPIQDHLPGVVSTEVIDTFNRDNRTFTSRPPARAVTIRDLLTNSSGIGYWFSNDTLFALIGGGRATTSLDYPLLHDPGARWTYGQSTRVLGMLVEQLSGQTLDRFMRDRLFEPLGMRDTAYGVAAAQLPRLATIHSRTDRGFDETPNPGDTITGAVRGDGGLFSTAEDYARFIRLVLNEGVGPDGMQLLTADTVALMSRDHVPYGFWVELQPGADRTRSRAFPLGAGRDGFGLGFQVTGDHDDPDVRAPGSLSWAGIFNTEFWIAPEQGMGAVLLMQYLPFYDDEAIDALQGFERRVYAHLK